MSHVKHIEGELDAHGARKYLASRLSLPEDVIEATDLGGGVSNHVVLVNTPGTRFVLKQSLPQLRVEEEWFSDRSRVFREAQALRMLAPVLPPDSVPEVLFEDPDQYAFGMSAAPARSSTWKSELMNGKASIAVAQNIARIHSALILNSWQDETLRARFGDQTAFEQLRLDPYYRVTAARNPDLAQNFLEAAERCRDDAKCLVHGDWSPKNLLVWDTNVMAIDFEVIHFGDPAFDVAFLLNHLLLKAMYLPQYASRYRDAASAYCETMEAQIPHWPWIEEGTRLHLPLLMLARVDGKSPAEYIREPALKNRVKSFSRSLLDRRADSLSSIFDRLV